MLNEIWPTVGWGSLEYGPPPGFTPGQVRGGRWKPLHYFYKNALMTDVMATSGNFGIIFGPFLAVSRLYATHARRETCSTSCPCNPIGCLLGACWVVGCLLGGACWVVGRGSGAFWLLVVRMLGACCVRVVCSCNPMLTRFQRPIWF